MVVAAVLVLKRPPSFSSVSGNHFGRNHQPDTAKRDIADRALSRKEATFVAALLNQNVRVI
jgi:hypothetical protein